MRLAKKRIAVALALVMGVAASGALSLACAGCSSSEENADPVFSEYDDTQVAATVNGVPIYEGEITRTIEVMRYQDSASYSDLAWAEVLQEAGLTPETLREKIINQYVQDELVIQECDRLGIIADNEAIGEQIEEARENFSSESEWTRALYRSGYYSEDAYRLTLEVSDLNDRLKESVTANVTSSADDAATYISENAYKYASRRSSCILITGTASMTYADMVETAQSILDEINSGSISFEDAATKYSADKSSSSQKGDVGWSSLVTLPDAYQTALESLSVGQVSGLISCSYGIYIIECTDEFSATKGSSVSVDSVPSDIRSALMDDLATAQESLAYTQYVNALSTSADIEIEDMPSDLSYDVDMNILNPKISSNFSTSIANTSTQTDDGDGLSPRALDYGEQPAVTDETVPEEQTTDAFALDGSSEATVANSS
jgi:foldase protein PrsA